MVKWDELIKELNRCKGDKSLKSIESFRQMVKTYTNNGVYAQIGKKMRTSQFEDIQSYCATIVQGIQKYGPKLSYKMTHLPVYRGIPSKFVRDADYKTNSIGYWPTYSSTTKQEEIAL